MKRTRIEIYKVVTKKEKKDRATRLQFTKNILKRIYHQVLSQSAIINFKKMAGSFTTTWKWWQKEKKDEPNTLIRRKIYTLPNKSPSLRILALDTQRL